MSSWTLEVIAPPVVVAVLVLLAAAMSVDYFGLARRHTGWSGKIRPTRASRAMLHALERRFARERESGALRTGATARSLLVALAEHGELSRAGAVVDFLATDAATRGHRDVVADALRALALAELGRLGEAQIVDRAVGARAGAQPVVALARARIAELDGRPGDALAAIDRASPLTRDLALVRARLCARVGRLDDARLELIRLAAGDRPAVEALLAPDACDAAVAQAARQALGMGAVYR